MDGMKLWRRAALCLLILLLPLTLIPMAVLGAGLPALLIVGAAYALLCGGAARVFAAAVVKPMNDGGRLYDELAPFAAKLARERQAGRERYSELSARADAIRVVTSHMREGFILIDHSGKTLLANAAAGEIFRAGELAGQDILRVCRDMELTQSVKQCVGGRRAETEITRDGRVYRVFLNPVYEQSAAAGAVILFLDVTERYAAERARKEFSANVSHELKTPLTAISASAEILASGLAAPEDAQAFAQKITAQTERLIRLIDDIIRLSEFDEGSAAGGYTEFAPRDVAESVILALKDKAAAKNVTVTLDGPLETVSANMGLIDELLYNLVDNAIQYNRPGGQLNARLAFTAETLEIRVSDTGVGIAREHLPHIFDRFYRVDKSRARRAGGTGLGLSIVKHIAEYHKGGVSIESAEGVGTTVTAVIPR